MTAAAAVAMAAAAGRLAPLVLHVETIATPLGDFRLLEAPGGVLHAADFADCDPRLHRLLTERHGAGWQLAAGRVATATTQALAAYFAGDVVALDRIALRTGGTAFQASVWAALRHVDAGRPISYAALADRLGRPRSARAVGHANGRNPVSIVIPCHRLVGAGGALTGYGGGIERKRWLLDHEARHAAATVSPSERAKSPSPELESVYVAR